MAWGGGQGWGVSRAPKARVPWPVRPYLAGATRSLPPVGPRLTAAQTVDDARTPNEVLVGGRYCRLGGGGGGGHTVSQLWKVLGVVSVVAAAVLRLLFESHAAAAWGVVCARSSRPQGEGPTTVADTLSPLERW